MPGSCSLSPHIAVAWLNAPIEIRNIAYGDQKNDNYLAINPKGPRCALMTVTS
jgi:glutathione S-transferase